MISRFMFLLALTVLLSACGVKNDLEVPNGQLPAEDERDPSLPPQPLGL